MSRILLEVCVDTLEGAMIAAECGVDRIELCSALGDGGLTPSYGFMHAATLLPVPVYAMMRPRGGSFVYSEAEKKLIVEDVQAAEDLGLAGIVVGATTSEDKLDVDFLQNVLSRTSLKATLHRAFDTLADPIEGLNTALELGFERILTSGQATNAKDGRDLLVELVEKANGKISIMAGSSVTAENVGEILAFTKVPEVHASCSVRMNPVCNTQPVYSTRFFLSSGREDD